jgi:hypothetical protein
MLMRPNAEQSVQFLGSLKDWEKAMLVAKAAGMTEYAESEENIQGLLCDLFVEATSEFNATKTKLLRSSECQGLGSFIQRVVQRAIYGEKTFTYGLVAAIAALGGVAELVA